MIGVTFFCIFQRLAKYSVEQFSFTLTGFGGSQNPLSKHDSIYAFPENFSSLPYFSLLPLPNLLPSLVLAENKDFPGGCQENLAYIKFMKSLSLIVRHDLETSWL